MSQTNKPELLERPVLVDGGNLDDPEAERKAGSEYISVGRAGAVNPALHSPAGTGVAWGRLLLVSN